MGLGALCITYMVLAMSRSCSYANDDKGGLTAAAQPRQRRLSCRWNSLKHVMVCGLVLPPPQNQPAQVVSSFEEYAGSAPASPGKPLDFRGYEKSAKHSPSSRQPRFKVPVRATSLGLLTTQLPTAPLKGTKTLWLPQHATLPS